MSDFRRRVLCSASAILIAASSGAAAADAERSQSQFREALTSLEAGDADAAVIHLRNALQKDGGNIGARRLLGELYLRRGNAASAEKELRRAHEAGADRKTTVLLGQALIELDRAEEVLGLVGPGERDPALATLLGQAYVGLRRTAEAEARFRAVLAADPGRAGARYWLARIETDRGDFDAADRRLAGIPAGTDEHVAALLLRAEIARLRNHPEDALRHIGAADAAAPDNPHVLVARAATLLQLGYPKRAGDDVRRALELHPGLTEAQQAQAWIAIARNDHETAHRIVNALGDRMRDEPSMLLLKGTVKFHAGLYAQAEDALLRFIRDNPEQASARRLLALVHLRSGRPAGALAHVAPLAAAPDPDPAILSLKAEALLQLGRAGEAVPVFEHLSRTGRVDAGLMRAALAMLGAPDGRSEVARGILLVLSRICTEQLDAASAEATRLARLEPDDPVVAHSLAAVQSAQGDDEAARATLLRAHDAHPEALHILDALDRIDALHGERRLIEARLRLRVAKAPGDEAMVLRLVRFLAEESAAAAVAALDDGVAANPRSVLLRRAQVDLYGRMGRRDAALADAAGLLQAHAKDSPALLHDAAAGFTLAGMPDRALVAARGLLKAQPSSTEARLLVLRILLQAGRDAEAQPLADALVDGAGKDPALVERVVRLYLEAGRSEQAVGIARRAGATDPGGLERIRADALVRTGRVEEARELLERSMAAQPDGHTARALFGVRQTLGRGDEALTGLAAWVAGHPEDVPARLVLADALMQRKRNGEAAAHYEAVLARAPDTLLALNNLAWLRQEAGDPGAVALARRAVRLAPRSAAAADTLGWILLRFGETDEGTRLLREAAAQVPANPDIQYHYAFALHAGGKDAAARSVLGRLAGSDRPFASRNDALALLAALR